MPKTDVLADAPQHLTKLIELRQRLSISRRDWLDAKEHASECKKTYDGDREKIANYLKDLTEDDMFDKASNGKEKDPVKPAKEATELKPVWPFPLNDGMRKLTMEEVSKREEVYSFGATLVSSLRDKGFKVAGDVEVFCAGTEKNAKLTDLAAKGIEKLLKEVGQRQGTILLNALADVKAKWVEPAKGETKKPEGWPFPVDGPLADHTISQVAHKFTKLVTTAVSVKLVEANLTTISDLNEQLKEGDIKPLVSLIGPGPAKKLVEAVSKYIAETV